MTTLRISKVAVGLATVGALLTACGGTGASGDTGSTVRISYLIAESGDNASMGSQNQAGVALAVEEINRTGFLGHGQKLDVETVDTAGDPARAIAAANRAVRDDDVVGMLCCVFSSVNAGIRPVVEKAGMPVVTTGTIGDAPESDVVFRGHPKIQPATSQIVGQIVDAFSPDSAAIVYTQDNEAMAVDEKVAEKALHADGTDDIAVVGTAAADTNYSGAATQVADQEPDVVLVDLLGNSNAAMIKALRDRGYQGIIFANTVTASQDQWEVAGKALTGTLMPVAFNPAGEEESVQNLVDRWDEKYPDREIDQLAANAYLATWLMARGIKNAGDDPTREEVLGGLHKIGVINTAEGKLKYDAKGEPERLNKYDFVQWNAQGEIVTWDGSAQGHVNRD